MKWILIFGLIFFSGCAKLSHLLLKAGFSISKKVSPY